MAARKLVDTTMTSLLFLVLLLVPATGARYGTGGAIETQAGIMPMDGVSPVPTEAPGLNGIPNELQRRAIASVNWCGLIDGNPQDILSCAPYTSCVLQNNFYIACCNSLNTDLCFISNYVLPTTCFGYSIYPVYPTVGPLTLSCSSLYYPYCITFTSYGFSPQFGCAATSYPLIHSLVPVADYYLSLSTTSSIISPYTSTAQIPATTTPQSRTPTPIIDDDSDSGGKPKFRLPKSAKAGIGSAAGLVTLAVIAFLSFCFRRRRNRAHVSPTDGDANPVMAQTSKTPQDYQNQPQLQGYHGAALPVQQQYQPQPQGYQNATQQYQPQLDNTKFPDSADSPPQYPAPIYTSGSQHTPAAPIPRNEPTSDPKIASNYPSSTVTPAPPLSPNPSHQTPQQQQNRSPSWDYPPNSPISELGPERSDLHRQEIPASHFGLGEAGAQHHTGTPWNHSELPGVGEARTHYPGPPNNNPSELSP